MTDNKNKAFKRMKGGDSKYHAGHLELLAPGGSFESVKAAFSAGADAVYMGGDRFSARAYAQSVEEHSLEASIDYAHIHDRKLYLTLNTLLKQDELEADLYSYVAPLYERGLDGILVQDLGVLRFIRREFPDLPVHASTQMTVTDAAGAKLLKSLGVVRVVAARELNLKELRSIYDATGMELEAFVHGAICYCYSGRCLYSSLIGGRSGNRGRCAQPCRLPYELKSGDGKRLSRKNEEYLLSLKDMCTLEYLPQMAEAGVMSFKIEGRMKSPLYTAGIVSIYRKYLDRYLEEGGRNWKVDEKDVRAVSEFFDRGGFTQYLTKHNGRDMMALQEKPKLRKPDQALMNETEKKYLNQELKEDISGFVSITEGNPAVITLSNDWVSASAVSEAPVQESLNRPLTADNVTKQLNKLGGTPFAMKELSMELSDRAFMPVKQLNELRREAVEMLEGGILDYYRRGLPQTASENVDPDNKSQAGKEQLQNPDDETASKVQPDLIAEYSYNNVPGKTWNPEIRVSLPDPVLLDTVLSYECVDQVELDCSSLKPEQITALAKNCHAAGKKLFIRLPEILRGKALADIRMYADSDADGLTVANLDELYALAEYGYRKPVITAQSVYLWNTEAKNKLKEIAESAGITLYGSTASYELNAKELSRCGIQDMQLCVYGHMPMMVTANCLRKTEGVCRMQKGTPDVKGPLMLIDRKHAQMPVICSCRYCYNTIYNALPTYLLDRCEQISELKPQALLISFTVESGNEVKAVLEETSALKEQLAGRGSQTEVKLQADRNYTRGHFQRGVL